MRKTLILLLTFMLLLMSGCSMFSKDTEEEGPPAGVKPLDPSQVPQNPTGEELSFDLELPADPDFNEDLEPDPTGDGSLMDPTDTPNTGDGASDADYEPLYIEMDGYAYELDPITFEPIDVPLDPITRLPVNAEVDDAVLVDEVDDNFYEEHPSAEEPTEETKYPNTGIFTEDD